MQGTRILVNYRVVQCLKFQVPEACLLIHFSDKLLYKLKCASKTF